MAINVQCESCQKVYSLKDSMAGKKARCRQCGAVINIPAIEMPEEQPDKPEVKRQPKKSPARKTEPAPHRNKLAAQPAPTAGRPADELAAASYRSEGSTATADEEPVALHLVQPEPSGLATASFVLGILSMTIFFFFVGIPAIILGFVARDRIKGSGGTLTGEGKANKGIVLGFISILLTMAIAGVIVLFYATHRKEIAEITEEMPEMNLLNPISTGKKAASKIVLTSIGQLIMYYATMNDERLPDSLEAMVADRYLDEKYLYIPKISGQASEFKYVYLGKGKRITAAPQTIIAHGVPEAHNGEGCYILYLNGETKWVTPEELDAERARGGFTPYEVKKVE